MASQKNSRKEEEVSERFFREKEDHNSNLFGGWEWSEWYAVMAPGCLRYKITNWHDRAEQSPGIRIRQNTLDELFSDACYENTVYEMMMVRGTLNVPVYLGQTPRKLGGRLGEHCSNGSHIKTFINLALTNDYQIFVRVKQNWKSTDGPKDLERCVLETYDYAWTTENNVATRTVITKNISGNAGSLRILREIVDDNILGDRWQWTNWKRIMKPGRALGQDGTWRTRRNGRLHRQVTSGQTLKYSKVTDAYPRYIAQSYGILN